MSNSRNIADSAPVINFIDGVTSNIQTQLNAKATSPVNLASAVTSILPVANGGTGAATLTANNVLLGNGTSAPLAVAPSTSGNVLTSNGSTWQSTAPAGGGSWVLLSTITASNAATVTFESNIDSTYSRYVIIGSGIYGSASAGFGALLKIGGSFKTNGYYYQHVRQALGSSGSTSFNYGTGSSAASIANNLSGNDVSTSAAQPANIVFQFDTPSANAYQTVRYDGVTITGNTSANRSIGGCLMTYHQGAMTGIRFQLFSGNIYGSFSLYGIAK